MKHLILSLGLLLLVLQTSCGVRRVSNEPQTPLVVDTILQTDLTQKEAYNKAAEWVATSYNSAQHVRQLDDKELGTIIGKGVFQHKYGNSSNIWGNIHYTIIIKCKDNRIRVTLQDFSHEALIKSTLSKDLGLVNTGKQPEWGHIKFVKAYWADLQRSCKAYSQTLITDLNNALKNKDDENW